MKLHTLLTILLLLTHSICNSFAIEIFDQKFGLHYTHTNGSHFGQTLSLYSQKLRSGTFQNSVLAGAPLESIPGASRPNTGNTLNCQIDLINDNISNCIPLDLLGILEDNEENSLGDVTQVLEEKKGMLMGSSLYSSAVSGQIITCGPLYKTITVGDIEHPIGLCHVLKGLNSTSEVVSPCRVNDCSQLSGSPLNYGYCMAGFSSTFFSGGEEVMLGGPGRGFFQGAGFKGRDADCFLQTTPMDNLPNFGFVGYSVVIGRVFNRNKDTVVLSAPRANLFGEILVYSNSTEHFIQILTRIDSVNGSYGGYLGYSMVTADIDGDGLDEIIASEPLYSDFELRLIEIGRVLVIGVNNVTNQLEVRFSFSAPDPIPYSKFGTAMTVIGDLDKDGYPELAISAPFSPNGGTVYIYRSSTSGLDIVPVQVLLAPDYGPIGLTLKSFGFSLASAADIDNNGYEDLLIGAPLSDHVVLVRSNRLVRIDAIFSSTLDVVNIKSVQRCGVVVGGEMMEFGCFDVTYNFSYIGWPAPDWIVIDVNISVDITRVSSGLNTRGSFFSEGELVGSVRETMNISEGEYFLVTNRVYLSESIFYLSTPLEFIATFEIDGSNRRDYFSSAVIIDPISKQSNGAVQLINANCGLDNRCDPILRLNAYFTFLPDSLTNQLPVSLTPGRAREFMVHLEVGNMGEEAYEPRIKFQHLKEISFRSTNTSIITDNHISETELILSLGNIINQAEVYDIVIVFATTNNIPGDQFVTIEIEFYSENTFGESEYASTNLSLEIPVKTEINIISNAINLRDTTHKTVNSYIPLADNRNQDVDIIGQNTVHHYTIRNLGPWSGNSSLRLTLTIYWPMGNLLSNEFYLYLTGIQATEATCEKFYLNKLNFSVPTTPNRRRRSNTSQISEIMRKVRETYQITKTNGDIILDCRETPENCVKIQCFIKPLNVGKSSSIQISSNVYEPTLTKYSPYGVWNLTSFALLNVTSSADVIVLTQDNAFVTTIVRPEDTMSPPDNAPAWYIYVIPTVLLVVMVIVIAIVVLYLVEVFRAKKKKREHRPLHDSNQLEQEEPMGEEN
ncbi:Integrin alpha [Oopsacas minuta]|uniref:Integrin alpha n=1 Tax=Oopsacas minuta TaxID=111878 RepID=A0AAV7KGU7_9METZ|nr:Integrin alpha [Oopsacas minuta]